MERNRASGNENDFFLYLLGRGDKMVKSFYLHSARQNVAQKEGESSVNIYTYNMG
jgi:hypothetical protein